MSQRRPNSIVLTDWGAYASVYQSPTKLITDLIILSLLYDEVLIQDEILVLSDVMPRWFQGRSGSSLLNMIFALDSVVLLKWPVAAYTSNVKVNPVDNPIQARAEWHVRNSTRGDQIFEPDEEHKIFYKQLEAALTCRKSSARERGRNKKIDIGQDFKKILGEVLSDRRYDSWLSSLYLSLSQRVSDDILRYMDDPSLAVRDLNDSGFHVNTVMHDNGPVFNRSLGFQISKMYNDAERSCLQQLIQSVYSMPLCKSEEAIGRYSGLLKEVPWGGSGARAPEPAGEPTVRVEAIVNTTLSLPEHFDDFPSIINKVRDTEEGRRLRETMGRLGQDATFSEVSDCWAAVAEVLASHIKAATYNARTTALNIAGKIVMGTVLGPILETFVPGGGGLLSTYLASALGSAIGEGVGVAFDHGFQSVRNDLTNHTLRAQIEESVKFRCSWIPYAEHGAACQGKKDTSLLM